MKDWIPGIIGGLLLAGAVAFLITVATLLAIWLLS